MEIRQLMPIKMVQMGNWESWLVSHLSEALRWYGLKIGPVKVIILAMMESNLTHPLVLWALLRTVCPYVHQTSAKPSEFRGVDEAFQS